MQQEECPSVTSPSSRSRIDPAANLHSQIFGFTARGRLCSSRPGGRGPAVTAVAAPRSMAGREASWGRGCAGAGPCCSTHDPPSAPTGLRSSCGACSGGSTRATSAGAQPGCSPGPHTATHRRYRPAQGAEAPGTGRGRLRLGHTATAMGGHGLVPEGVWLGRGMGRSGTGGAGAAPTDGHYTASMDTTPQPSSGALPPWVPTPGPTAHAGGSALTLAQGPRTRLPGHASSPVARHAPRSARSLGPAKLVSGGANVSRAGAKRQMRLRPRLAPSFHPRPHLSRRRAAGRRNWRLSRPRNPAPAVIYGWLRGTPAALRNYGAFKARGQRSSTAPPAELEESG